MRSLLRHPPSRRRRRAIRRLLLAFGVLIAADRAALANPNGGVVRGGRASIAGQGTSRVDVIQRSQSAVLSWEHFDIAPGEVTNFHQPNANATAINRILQQNPSQILGALHANGNVYLINPNGFLFGSTATINTHSFAAMTGIDAEGLKKLSGGYDASAQSAPGAKIENHGAIAAGDGGFVYLIAPRVENGSDGVITTPQGEVLLAAGATVTLTDDPGGVGLGIRYTAPGAPGGEAVNLGKLVANGGFARMRADFVRQGGAVQANAVRERAGKIELYATTRLALESGSVTDASGGSGSGPGGEISAKSAGDARVDASAMVDVSGGAAGGDGGTAEVSAKDVLSLGGTLRAGAAAGSKRGSIVIDPTVLLVPSQVNLRGAGSITADTEGRIEVESNATINLVDDAGDGKADRQSFTLRAGGDISFGNGARIVDDGSGAGGQKIWDVNLVAGADLTSSDLLALSPSGSKGSIYLSGANYDATGAFRSLGTNNGEVALTHGDLTVRATGDLVVGDGGGLKDQTGAIDIQVRGDVKFRAGSQTDDGVIENGSGDISIVAGGSVLLGEGPNVQGNAAIRTRGIVGTDAGQTTVSDGGSIYIQAGGDVDAGIGNRWLEPGPSFSKQSLLHDLNPADFGLPPDYVPPDYDPMPVVREGILGIGTEAGGNVTIVAGKNVRTGVSNQPRSGATASGLGTQYSGSHIGVFGVPVTRVVDPIFGVERNVPMPGAPEGHLTVVAGDSIEGDFVARNGEATFRAGFKLADGETARSLDPGAVDAKIVDANPADATHGWFGTLARPVTVDLIDASTDGTGRNGVAIRAIENPSMVYPPAISGTSAVPTWRPTDSATLRSTDGDVILVGNDINLPNAASPTAAPNKMVRVLPPNVRIETDRGDLVLLNDFLIYPSDRGGLNLQIAGEVRTAGFSASSAAVLGLLVQTLGASGDVSFRLPAGTRLRDPRTGTEYTLTNQVMVNSRDPAKPTTGAVVFHVAAGSADKGVVVPAGTRVSTSDGRVYRVLQDAVLLPAAQRLSQGQVTLFFSGAGAPPGFQIPPQAEFVGPGGARFMVTGAAPPIVAGQTQVTVSVIAEKPGVDVSALGLSPATPIAGVSYATNLQPTRRLADITATVQAVDPGTAGNADPFFVTALLDKVPGIESVANARGLSGGVDLALTGIGVGPPTQTGNQPQARATVLGPVGDLPVGAALVLEDPSLLPAGVDPSQLSITVDQVVTPAMVAPALFRSLKREPDGSYRPDPDPGAVAITSPTSAWIRDGDGISAKIIQSDADPGIDGRGLNASFDYASYLANCRSGLTCQQGRFGTGPTHADDPTRDELRALGGFDRVAIQLAKPAFVLTGDPGPDGIFGTGDDGNGGSLVDFALITQHSKASDETVVWAPIGDASFGAVSPAPGVDPNPYSGLQVSGPGSAKLLVGVLPNAPQVDANGNGRIDPEESTGDRNGDGAVDKSEWRGSAEVFAGLDQADRTYSQSASGPIFVARPQFDLSPKPPGDGLITPAETPYVPSGRGGEIQLAGAPAGELASQLPLTLGISTIGNAFTPQGDTPVLPTGSASLFVAADQTIDLNSRGSIETYQGSRLVVESVSGGVSAGSPPKDYNQRRGIVTVFRSFGTGQSSAGGTGGGPIGVDTHGDFSVGGLALAALSGSSIDVYSRGGSIDAGVGIPFQNPQVTVTASGNVVISYDGAGINSLGGNVNLHARQDVRIGAGISGAGITVDAGRNVESTGSGTIQGTGSVSVSAQGTISGTISSGGNVTVSGNVAQGSNISAGGVVAGAGAGIGSNTSGGKVSAELNDLQDKAAQTAATGFQTAMAAATGTSHGVVIQVSSCVIGDAKCH